MERQIAFLCSLPSGAKFSAYRWQRLGAVLTRITHSILEHMPHRAWLYVDDLLLLLRTAEHQEQAALVIAWLAAIEAPISWRKAQLGQQILWCGWTFNFAQETVHLTAEKLAKLRAQLQSLTSSKKILRKCLEQCIGLLMWATSTCRHLRPYLAPLYKDLHSAKGTLKQVHPSQWQHFLDALGPNATVQRQPLGLWLPMHARITDVGNMQVHSKTDIPRVPTAHKATWVRISDPSRTEIHLRDESRQAIAWFLSCFIHDRTTSIRQRNTLHCLAAADAMAQHDTVGIGGRIITASQCAWFSEKWSMQQLRTVWPSCKKTRKNT